MSSRFVPVCGNGCPTESAIAEIRLRSFAANSSANASGVSSGPNELEGAYAESWGKNIWADMLS